MDNRTRNVLVELPGFGSIKVEAVVTGREQDVSSVKDMFSLGEVNKMITPALLKIRSLAKNKINDSVID